MRRIHSVVQSAGRRAHSFKAGTHSFLTRVHSTGAHGDSQDQFAWVVPAGCVVVGAAALGVHNAQCETEFKVMDLQKFNPDKRPDLPTIKLAEMQKHTTEDDIWVSFRGAVYNVSGFATAHPGETGRLLMAGGGDLEPFWNVYRQHFRGHVLSFLEKYRIGNLSAADAKESRSVTKFEDVFATDPPRHKDCEPCSMKPFCGETRLDLLAESYYTPNEIFYTRNHFNVPDVSEEDYELVVEDCPELGIKGRTFSLHELKTLFPKTQVASTMQCAGNRGEDFHGLDGKPVFNAPHWNVAAISNGLWGGARMRDVLAACGMDVDGLSSGKKKAVGSKNKYGEMYNQQDWHVHFESYDTDETGDPFCGSTYLDKVVDPFGDCLVCYELNGRDLPRDHGFPVRALVPGHAGARQPKWLHSIALESYPHPTLQCRGMGPNIDFENDLSVWPPKCGLEYIKTVQEMPVQSLVCSPSQNSRFNPEGDFVEVKGVAWSGGGSGIYRVDVTIDGGKTWDVAKLYKPVVQHRRSQFGWTQFTHSVPLTAAMKAQRALGKPVELEITSKAVDSHFNVQPDDPRPHWNSRGVAVNHWYRVKSLLDPKMARGATKNTQAELNAEGSFANTPTGGKFNVPWNEHGWSVPPQAKGQGHSDWIQHSTRANTSSEPGIKEGVDWEHYKNLKCAPFWEQPR